MCKIVHLPLYFLCECIKIIASIYAISYKVTVRAMHSYKRGEGERFMISNQILQIQLMALKELREPIFV